MASSELNILPPLQFDFENFPIVRGRRGFRWKVCPCDYNTLFAYLAYHGAWLEHNTDCTGIAMVLLKDRGEWCPQFSVFKRESSSWFKDLGWQMTSCMVLMSLSVRVIFAFYITKGEHGHYIQDRSRFITSRGEFFWGGKLSYFRFQVVEKE